MLTDSTTHSASPVAALTLAALLLLGLAAGGVWSVVQVGMVPSSLPPLMAVSADGHNAALSKDAHSQLSLSASGPEWKDITPAQRDVLTPLRNRWSSMGALTKRRWLVLADRYPHMEQTERNKLLSRMKTWASLSAQQRNQARLNFENTKRLSAQDLQSKWDEYQALSLAEKERLAAEARKAKQAALAKARAKRKLTSAPPAPKPVLITPAPHIAPAPNVETGAVHTPKAAPAVQLAPLPAPAAASQPVNVPQSIPTLDLPPLTETARPAPSTATLTGSDKPTGTILHTAPTSPALPTP